MGTVRLQERIAELARQRATAVSLRDLWKHGHKPSPSVRLQNAIFLQHELPIRMAQRIEELRNLPFGLGHDSKPILQVIDWYSSFVDTLTAMPRPRDQDDERRFTATIEAQLQTPSVVEMMLSSAVRCQSSGETLDEPLRSRPGATRTQQRKYMQSVLDRFFTARIGLRFLMEHHIQSGKEQEDGWAGVIQANFDPTHVLQHAADDARHLCDREFGVAPDVHIRMADEEDSPSATRNNRLTSVPSHMHYICTELLKNAMRATTERHQDADSLPPITVTAAFGEDHLGIRIADEGGGIPLSQVRRIWQYAYTTAPTPLLELDTSGTAPTTRRSALAGFGMGLPLSRLYAQYLGGRLDVRSLEGHGTDCYLHLSRLGAACETVPAMVSTSPAERESTPAPGATPHDSYSMRGLSEYEHAVLSEQLAELRHGHSPSIRQNSL